MSRKVHDSVHAVLIEQSGHQSHVSGVSHHQLAMKHRISVSL